MPLFNKILRSNINRFKRRIVMLSPSITKYIFEIVSIIIFEMKIERIMKITFLNIDFIMRANQLK